MKIGVGTSFFCVLGLVASVASAKRFEGKKEDDTNFVPAGYSGASKKERFPFCRRCTPIDSFEQLFHSKSGIVNICPWRGVISVDPSDAIDIDYDDVHLEINCCRKYGKSCTFDGGNYDRSTDLINFDGTVKHFVLRGFTFQNFGNEEQATTFTLIDFMKTAKFEILYNIFHSNVQLDNIISNSEEHGSVGTFIGNEFSNNDYPSGSGLDIDNGYFMVKDCVFYKNSGSSVIDPDEATLEIIDTRFLENKDPKNNGCAIDLCESVLTLRGCLFYKNEALSDGGAIEAENSRITAYDTKFIQNEAGGEGGAIETNGFGLFLHRCSFEKNKATGSGGAIKAGSNSTDHGCLVELNQCTFDSNTCTTSKCDGGAIQLANSELISRRSEFHYNIAKDEGGAIYSDDSRIESYGDTFKLNRAKDGGAIKIDDHTMDCSGSKFMSNTAVGSGGDGGAIFLDESVLRSKGCTYTDNKADDDGNNIRVFNSLFLSCKDDFGQSYYRPPYGRQFYYGRTNYGKSYYGGNNNGISENDESCVSFECPGK